MLQDDTVDELLERVLNGDGLAWQALWQAVEPTVWAMTGRGGITGPLAEQDDERRNIVLEVMSRLQADDFRRLRLYVESARRRRGRSSFKTWLATVTARTAIDYVRAHPEYRDLRSSDRSDRWVRLVPVDGSEPARTRLDPAALSMATLMLEQARSLLREDQLAALYCWLQGESRAEIAARLDLATTADARRLVRSALKRLRDRYREVSTQSAAIGDQEPLS